MQKIIKNEKVVRYLWYSGVFLFMFIWFSLVHPLVVYDADDWTYIAYARRAVPSTNEWNPAKLFPEIVLPLCSALASRVIYPLTGKFIQSITWITAVIVSSFIVLYIHSLYEFLKRLFSISSNNSISVELLFLILHFLVFRYGDSDNTYLFYCDNLNCYYNYLLPALLNASLVFYMVKNEKFYEFLENGNAVGRGLLCIVFYFAIFSNLVDNIILGVYAGSMLLFDLNKIIKHKMSFNNLFRKNWFHIGILAAWGVCAVFEMMGQRANVDIGDTRTFAEKLQVTFQGTAAMAAQIHKMFILVMLGLFVAGAGMFLIEKKKDIDNTFIAQAGSWLFGTVIMFVYMILLCTKVNANNIGRSEYLFPFFFYLITLMMVCFGYVLVKQEKVMVIVPLMLCIICSFVNTNKDTFKEANYSGISGKLCMQISNDQVEQIVAADLEGKDSISIEVAQVDTVGNWPQTTYMGELMSRALYKHGIISKPMVITIVPSEAFNQKYNMNQW